VASVRTVLLGLTPSDVVGPLADFQHTTLHDKEDMLRFMQSINERCHKSLDKAVLERSFETNWDDLVARLELIPNERQKASDEPLRSSDQLLGEILERVRSLERRIDLVGEGFEEVRSLLKREQDLDRSLLKREQDLDRSLLKREQDRAQRSDKETVSRIAKTRMPITNDRNRLIGEEFESDHRLAELAGIRSEIDNRRLDQHVVHNKFGPGEISDMIGTSPTGDEMVVVRFESGEREIVKLSSLRPM